MCFVDVRLSMICNFCIYCNLFWTPFWPSLCSQFTFSPSLGLRIAAPCSLWEIPTKACYTVASPELRNNITHINLTFSQLKTGLTLAPLIPQLAKQDIYEFKQGFILLLATPSWQWGKLCTQISPFQMESQVPKHDSRDLNITDQSNLLEFQAYFETVHCIFSCHQSHCSFYRHQFFFTKCAETCLLTWLFQSGDRLK